MAENKPRKMEPATGDSRANETPRPRPGGPARDASSQGQGATSPDTTESAAIGSADSSPEGRGQSGKSVLPATGEQESSTRGAGEEGDDHIGATEDEVDPVPAPSGDEFDDEPRQG
jgi:hypothetical protein